MSNEEIVARIHAGEAGRYAELWDRVVNRKQIRLWRRWMAVAGWNLTIL